MEGSEEPVGGQFPREDAELAGPFFAVGQVAADLEDVAAGIPLPGGAENAAEEAGRTGQRPEEETGRAGSQGHNPF